jgi:hypothetical protein
MWDHQHPTTLLASTACYEDIFIFVYIGSRRVRTARLRLLQDVEATLAKEDKAIGRQC